MQIDAPAVDAPPMEGGSEGAIGPGNVDGILDPPGADFGTMASVVGTTCTGPLAAGASCTFTLRFTPISPGYKSATLIVSTNFGQSVAAALVGSAVL
jgi:hypothetical protein